MSSGSSADEIWTVECLKLYRSQNTEIRSGGDESKEIQELLS
jgi:hypothetical protein